MKGDHDRSISRNVVMHRKFYTELSDINSTQLCISSVKTKRANSATGQILFSLNSSRSHSR